MAGELMGNIASVFVRIELREGRWVRSDLHVLGALLTWSGKSYHVPVVVEASRNTLDVQYGAKWSPYHGVARLAARTRDVVTRIWVRWYDSGGDHDLIYALEPEAPAEDHDQRPCRYGFDQVEHTTRGLTHRLALAGTYLCGNDRCTLLDGARLPSLTTPVRGGPWATDQIEPAPARTAVDELRSTADRIDFFWRGRLVHRSERGDRGLREYSLDHWDNCVDPAFAP